MSLVFNMSSLGKGMNAKGASAVAAGPSAGTAAGANAGVFSQTLVQSLTGAGAAAHLQTSVQTDSALNLQSLLASALGGTQGQESGEEGSSVKEVLNKLLPELAKLDDQIEADPALLAALQGWLMQVSALLTGNEGTAEDQTALSALAQNPATVRFAVQDQLNNLASLVQQASVNEQTAGQALNLLTSFASIIEPYMGATKANETAHTVIPALMNTNEVSGRSDPQNTKSADLTAQPLSSDRSQGNNVPGVQAQAAVDTESEQVSLIQEFKSVLVSLKKEHSEHKTDDLSANGNEDSSTQTDNKVVTAGQLSLREGITAPVKTEVQQVPVRQFANEMTSMITGKLEIINKDGIHEATISLFPEHLGQVDVKITMQNGHLVAQFVTEHSSAKDLLENQMSQLRAALQSQGLQVEKLEVTQNNTPLQSQLFQEGRQSGAGNQNSDRRSKERKDQNDDAILAAELDGELKEWLTEKQNTQALPGQFTAEA